uniref:Uncharacterized protein n=1 Tax=Phytophthora fragariae TaxID=53985 RepID=A0A6A3FML5_9STRA|nr:hypothetical protein PF009_g3099 [Phytophthora fragariae]
MLLSTGCGVLVRMISLASLAILAWGSSSFECKSAASTFAAITSTRNGDV